MTINSVEYCRIIALDFPESPEYYRIPWEIVPTCRVSLSFFLVIPPLFSYMTTEFRDVPTFPSSQEEDFGGW